MLKPVVERYEGKVARIYFRSDAGFANPEVYELNALRGLEKLRLKSVRKLLPQTADQALKARDGEFCAF